VLSEAPLENIAAADIEGALVDAVARNGLAALPWDEHTTNLRARIALLRSLEGADVWPDWSDAALTAALADWLPVSGVRRLSDFAGKLAPALEAQLTFAQRRRLEGATPARFETPAGGSHRIDYAHDGGPAVEVRLQELFGVAVHPALADGRVPLTLKLTSPAGRPVQTTRDLPGFWRGSYADVRADMRGRYPKHPWPEDPTTAPPTRRAKPKGT